VRDRVGRYQSRSTRWLGRSAVFPFRATVGISWEAWPPAGAMLSLGPGHRPGAAVVNAGFPVGLLADTDVFTMSDQHQPAAGRWWSLDPACNFQPAPSMNTAAISPDGTRVAAALWHIVVWDGATGRDLPTASRCAPWPSLDNKFLAVGKEDKTVPCGTWLPKSPSATAHLDQVWSVVFSLTAATWRRHAGRRVKLWDLSRRKRPRRYRWRTSKRCSSRR
jgi:hypothetical protein